MGYIGIYNTTDEDFIIEKVKKRGLIIEKINLNELYGPYINKYIEDTENLNEIIPAKGFFIIGYRGNYKDEEKTILVELISQDKNERYSIDLYFNDETEKYYGNYKISYRFAGNCDCSIIPDKCLSHLCDMLVIISEKIFKERFSNCKIF